METPQLLRTELVPMSNHFHREKKKKSALFLNDISSFSIFCSLLLVLPPERRAWLPFLYLHHQIFIHMDMISKNIFWSMLKSSRPSHSLHEMDSPSLQTAWCPFPDLLQCTFLSFTGEPSTGPSIQMYFPRAKGRRRISSLCLLAEFCLIQTKMLSALCQKGTLLAHGELSGSCPEDFSAHLPSSQSNPSCMGISGVVLPQMQVFAL